MKGATRPATDGQLAQREPAKDRDGDEGPVQIDVLRDREGTFDPVSVKKRQRR